MKYLFCQVPVFWKPIPGSEWVSYRVSGVGTALLDMTRIPSVMVSPVKSNSKAVCPGSVKVPEKTA
jgi:hypothetical protein